MYDDSNPATTTMTKDYIDIEVFERPLYDLEVLDEEQQGATEMVVSKLSGDYLYETVVELVTTRERDGGV